MQNEAEIPSPTDVMTDVRPDANPDILVSIRTSDLLRYREIEFAADRVQRLCMVWINGPLRLLQPRRQIPPQLLRLQRLLRHGRAGLV